MLVDVYHHRHWDNHNGRSVIIPHYSTAERIKRTGGEIIPETRRQIDESLLDGEGKALLQLNSEDWKLLKEIASMAGQKAVISGNQSRKPVEQLAKDRLLTYRALNISDTEHEVTDLGRLALKQLG